MAAPIPKTLEEAISCPHPQLILQWLEIASARDIQQFLHRPHTASIESEQLFINTALNIRLSEDAAATADKLSEQTNRLVVYTKQLKYLTWALFSVGIIQILIMVFQVLKNIK